MHRSDEIRVVEGIEKSMNDMNISQRQKRCELKSMVNDTRDETERARIRDDKLIDQIRAKKVLINFTTRQSVCKFSNPNLHCTVGISLQFSAEKFCTGIFRFVRRSRQEKCSIDS